MANYLYYVCGTLAIFQLTVSVFSTNVGSKDEQVEEKVQTFGQFTKAVAQEISPATLELLRNFKDRKIALIVERSSVYQNAADKITTEYKDSVESVSYLTNSVEYSFEKDSESIVRVTREAAATAKLVLMITSLRLAKECLVAAYDLKLHEGDHVFVTYEVNILNMLSLQRRPFKYPVVSYSTSVDETYDGYIRRSRKLCWMLEHTFLVMVTLPKHVMQVLNQRVPKLYRRDRKTMPDSVDMWKGIENVGFSRTGRYRSFVNNKNGNVKYPLAVYRYGMGKGAGARCANFLTNILSKSSTSDDHLNSYPKMHPIASFTLLKNEDSTWKLSLTRRNKLRTHKTFKNAADQAKPACVDSDKNCKRTKANFPLVELIFVLCVGIILFVAFLSMYRQYRKSQQKLYDEGKSLIPSEVKLIESGEYKQGESV